MRINILVLVYNIQMILKPTDRGYEIGRPTNRGHEIGKPTNKGHEFGRPTNGGHEIGRPTSGGHEIGRPTNKLKVTKLEDLRMEVTKLEDLRMEVTKLEDQRIEVTKVILPNEERRTIEDTDDSVLLILKSDAICVIIDRRLLHFLTMSESVDDQSINQRNGQNRGF